MGKQMGLVNLNRDRRGSAIWQLAGNLTDYALGSLDINLSSSFVRSGVNPEKA